MLRLILVAAFLLCSPLMAQGRGAIGSLLAGAADTDRNREVSEFEWVAFLAILEAQEDGNLDRHAVMARLIVPSLDRDGDGRLSKQDLQAIFQSKDGDGDGALQAGELSGRGGGGQGGNPLIDRLMLERADSDQDAAVSSVEWQSMLDALIMGEGDEIALASVKAWIVASREGRDEDRAAFTPGVYLLTLDSNLDQNRDGQIKIDDLQQIFSNLDQNGDRNLQASEFAGRARGGRGRGRGNRGTRGGGADAGWARVTSSHRAKPALIPWQRNLEDALALSKSTGKPLLLCVNMDGEVACESIAWVSYRDPEFAALASGFIPLLASPDRHNKRDFDDRGQRIVDPKFGRLINAEHIDIEPALYANYFNEQRVAPRHVGVDSSGKVLFDIYLVNDLRAVKESLKTHGRSDVVTADPASMSLGALLASPDALHREFLEQAFVAGDLAQRLKFAGLALSSSRVTQHPQLTRLALHDSIKSVRLQAVRNLSQNSDRAPMGLFPAAFFAAFGNASESAALIDALYQVSANTDDETRRTRAVRLMRSHSGLATDSRLLITAKWRQAINLQPLSVEKSLDVQELDELSARLDQLEELRRENPEDPSIDIMIAAATIRFARTTMLDGGNPTFLFEDARSAAERGLRGDLSRPQALAYMSWLNYLLGDMPQAVEHAAAALPLLVGNANSALTFQVLDIFASGRSQAIYTAIAENREWPASWIADICAAHEILLQHPLGSGKTTANGLDFLAAIEAFGYQADLVRRGLRRFPSDGKLHEHLRGQALADEGADALEAAYVALADVDDGSGNFQWYSGLASFLAAERQVQNKLPLAAMNAYRRAIEKFTLSISQNRGFESSASHYICLAQAGRATIFIDEGELAAAAKSLRFGISANPSSADSKDGLDTSPKETAQRCYRALLDRDMEELADSFRGAMTADGVSLNRGRGRRGR